MSAFESTGKLTITGKKLDQARADFKSARADTANTLETIKRYHSEFDYVLCPHSAVGVSAIHQLDTANSATVALATAHFAKFGDAVSMAINPLPEIPKELSRLWNMETRKSNCPNDATVVQAFMEKRIEERVANEEAGEKRKMQVRKLVLVSALVGLVAIVMRRRK
jgi:threonine synthase